MDFVIIGSVFDPANPYFSIGKNNVCVLHFKSNKQNTKDHYIPMGIQRDGLDTQWIINDPPHKILT